jgi:hypothetical protein
MGFATWYLSFGLLVLLAAFTAAVMINLIRGREIDCGCFGAGAARPITWATVGRNCVLIGMTIALNVLAKRLPVAEVGGFSPIRLPALIAAVVLVPGTTLLAEVVHLRKSAAAFAKVSHTP